MQCVRVGLLCVGVGVAVDKAEAHRVLGAVQQLGVELQRFVVVLNAKRLHELQENDTTSTQQSLRTRALQHQALVHDTTNKHVHDCTQFLTFASTSCISCSAYFLPRQRRGPKPNGAAAKLCLMLARSGESRSQRSGRNASGSSKNSARRDATP